jgi:nitronate monooxygenase
MVGTLALVSQVVDAVTVPVLASGGIMDGRGIAAALALGAAAVQMGTAFLTCDEAGIPNAYKQHLDNLRRKDALRGAETAEISVRLGNYSASHFEGSAYKEAILRAREHETRLTRAFSGRPARGIVNRFMTEVEHPDVADAILPFPLQNALTRPLRTTAAQQDRAEFLSLWAGQGVGLARRQAAATLIARLVHETEAVIQQLAVEHTKAR